MTSRRYRRAAAALGVMALTSNAIAADYTWDGSYSNTDGTLQQKLDLLRKKVKYVFVIFHENQSFDHYFGTYPGANGLYEAPKGYTPANQLSSFNQRYLDTSLHSQTISPFLVPQSVVSTNGTVVPVYPADFISVDHSHQGMANSMDVNMTTKMAANDRYALDEESLTTDSFGNIVTSKGVAPTSMTLAAVQKAQDDVSHIDCDTIPFMWSWAKNFVLYDNFHQTIVGPSTPNALAVLSGQTGATQWALHPDQGATTTYPNPSFPNVLGASYGSSVLPSDSNAYVPMVADAGPFPGSNLDTNQVKPPYNFDESPATPGLNLDYASLPLSFMGSNIESIVQNDPNPAADLLDVQEDIKKIAQFNKPVNWGWYQQGFDAKDRSDPYETPGTATVPTNNPPANSGYVLHHNAAQYFAYIADNPQVLSSNLHGAQDFFDTIEKQKLPADGGVFYLRGGYDNNPNYKPLDPTPGVQNAFLGNDDHGSYSDQQLTEALSAQAINAIAKSPYWSQSAIIITYDETDGLYDHAPFQMRNTFADGSVMDAGPRIPTLVISPYAAAGTISHRYSEHGSIIKFINELKGLIPLYELPDEQRGVRLGKSNLGQNNLGPSDNPYNDVGDLTEAFDMQRLKGEKPLIPASAATFTNAQVSNFPHLAKAHYSANGYTNGACYAIGVLPTDFKSFEQYKKGNPSDPYPADFNPRPTASPGTPTAGNWQP